MPAFTQSSSLYVEYSGLSSIPRASLWLDASDADSVVLSPFFNDWSWKFNGASYVTVPDSPNLDVGPGDFTLEFWCFFANTPGSQIIFTQRANTSTRCGIHLGVQSNGFNLYMSETGSAWDIAETALGDVDVGVWQHIALVRVANTITLLKNNTLVYSNATAITGPLFNSNANYIIGADASNSLFSNCFISNLRLTVGTGRYAPGDELPTAPLDPDSYTFLLLFQNSNILKDYSLEDNPVSVYGNPVATDPNTGTVSCWKDKTINELSAIQLIHNNKPVYKTQEVNGLNIMSFNGTSNFFTLTKEISTNLYNWSHFFVYKRFNGNDKNISLCKTNGQGSTFLHWESKNVYSGTNFSNNLIDSTTVNIGAVSKDTSLFVNNSAYNFTGNWGSVASFVDNVGFYNGSSYADGYICELMHVGFIAPNYELNLVSNTLIDKWKVPKVPPSIITPQTIFATTLSSLSSTIGTWAIEPTGFDIKWQKSTDNITFVDIPNQTTTIYNPTTSDYAAFIRTSIVASNIIGSSLSSTSNVLQLTTVNVSPVTVERTTIFTVSATPGVWSSTMPFTRLYRWQVSTNNGSNWTDFGSLTTSLTAYLSAYETTPVDARVIEYPRNSTLEAPV